MVFQIINRRIPTQEPSCGLKDAQQLGPEEAGGRVDDYFESATFTFECLRHVFIISTQFTCFQFTVAETHCDFVTTVGY